MSFSIAVKGIKKTADSIKKRNDIAAFRTVNVLQKRSLKAIQTEIKKQYPVTNKQINKVIKKRNARKDTPYAVWKIRGGRLDLAKAKAIKKGGISYVEYGKKRVKVNEPINGGSKPFMIQGQFSGKQVPVYRRSGVKTWQSKNMRSPVTTMKGHSIRWLFRKVDYMKDIRGVFDKEFKIEYRKQLDRAKF